MAIETNTETQSSQSVWIEDVWEPPMPPTDLIFDDDEPLKSNRHRIAMNTLIRSLQQAWCDRNDFFTGGNMFIYYSSTQARNRDFRGPDFFVVLGVENRPRRSWMLWAEQGKYPHVIIELLSNSTAKVDKGFKKTLYQDTFRTPEYFWFHPETLEFQGFHLMGGQYQPLEPNAQGRLWSQQLELFLGVHSSQLRFFTPENQLVSTPEERAEIAQQQAETAQQQAQAERRQRELAQQQVEELRARLKELGVEPDVPEQ